jgi:hypothetical protein
LHTLPVKQVRESTEILSLIDFLSLKAVPLIEARFLHLDLFSDHIDPFRLISMPHQAEANATIKV